MKPRLQAVLFYFSRLEFKGNAKKEESFKYSEIRESKYLLSNSIGLIM